MSKKSFLTFAIAGSNLFVLSLIFSVYWTNSSQKMEFYSSSPSRIQTKLEGECQEGAQEVVEGRRKTYICHLNQAKRGSGFSYTVKTRIVIKKDAGGHVVIETTGALRDRTRHALEADFCEECKYTESVASTSDVTEVMKEVIHLAETVEEKAKISVAEARRKFNQSKANQRLGRTKERQCLGTWDEEDKTFINFDEEEELNCKFRKFSRMNLIEREKYYNNTLKVDLWEQALSDDGDDYFLSSLLNQIIKRPYAYSLSVRASSHLIDNYLQWKDVFKNEEILNPTQFVQHMRKEAEVLTSLISAEQKQVDLSYFEKGLQEDFGTVL